MPNLTNAFDKATDFAGKTGTYQTGSAWTPEAFAGTIVQLVLQFLGVVFFGLMIYCGMTWMTASGDEKRVDTARKILKAAVIGLIVVVLAYAVSIFFVQSIAQHTLNNLQ